ncbi:MAG: YigZ family protein [Saprospiraceae bacterium]|nr:YigZ family protein [Saprospiraceae bacterium]MCB9325565.1 YigZ family protein [Lewinellaceae bacterium]
MKDEYKTIRELSTGEFRDKGSKFLAYAWPVYTQEEWQEHVNELKKEHFKAVHYCFAYRLGTDNNEFRANDDGEPSGSAGRPILGQIDSFGLTNILVVVVRYWGGTKLGIPGLINAYKTSSAAALQHAEIIEKTVEDIFRISFDYALMSNVMNAVKKVGVEMIHQDFSTTATLDIAIRKSEVEETCHQIRAQVAGVRIEEVEKWEKIEGFELKYLETR